MSIYLSKDKADVLLAIKQLLILTAFPRITREQANACLQNLRQMQDDRRDIEVQTNFGIRENGTLVLHLELAFKDTLKVTQ